MSIARFSTSIGLVTGLFAIGCAESSSSLPVLTYDEFKAQAYQEPDTGVWIVNGDEMIADEEAMRATYQSYLNSVEEAQLAEDGYGVTRGNLIVNLVGGSDDKWTGAAANNITYCVSSSSFGSRYAAVVNAMASAGAAWKASPANITFVHSTANDSNCSRRTGTVFNVRQVTGQPFLARSFFPSSSRRQREVLIDSSSFGNISPWTLTGILRHELGHTLGFRHEHTRPESGTCFEDNSWRALTTYDSASVMHYPQCNGTNTGDLNLTTRDQAGAHSLYP